MDTNSLEHTIPGHLFRILLTMLCLFHHKIGTYSEDQLQIDPPSIVVQFGSPASANCSTNEKHEGMGWEATQGSTDMFKGVQFVIWSVERLEVWDIKPICYANFPHSQPKKDLNITIYKPLEQVTIRTMDHTMTEGREYELKCYIPNVAPVHLLTVNWYKGQDLIDSMSNFNSSKHPVNHTATLQISPHRSDDGVQYRCEAELKLGPEGPQPPPKMKSDPLTFTVHYGPEFSNCDNVVNLTEGRSLAGICNVTGNPAPDSHWKKDGQNIDPTIPLNRTSGGQYNIFVSGNITRTLFVNVMYGPEISCKSHYTLREGEIFDPNCTAKGFPKPDISWSKDGNEVDLPLTIYKTDVGQYLITANNNISTANYAVELNVLYPPSTISELEERQVSSGENLELKCASKANPRPSYRWIYHESSNVHITNEDGVSLLHITHAGGDNIGTYKCIASNDLGEKEKTVRVNVEGAKATCPLSVHPNVVDVRKGETVSVECKTSKPTESLQWKFGESVIRNSTLEVKSSDHSYGKLKATCRGSFVGLDDCQKDLDVTIYNLPEKLLISTVNHTGPMGENKNYTLTCHVENFKPVELRTVTWYKQDMMETNWTKIKTDNSSSTLRIKASRGDTETLYSCEAELGLQTPAKVRSDPLKLTTHYKPNITGKSAQRVALFLGYPVKLTCEASGYPIPNFTWTYNSHMSIGPNFTVVENPGEYICNASNYLGSDTKIVTVVLEVDYLPLIAGFVAVVVVIISVIFILIYSIYYKNTKMGHYTVEGAKPSAQNGNIAQNGRDNSIPMKKILV